MIQLMVWGLILYAAWCFIKMFFSVPSQESSYLSYKADAEKGNANAQYRLGLFYETGYGVDKNSNEAINWYRKAAEQGHKEAKAELKKLEKIAQSSKETNPGDAQTQYELGLRYAKGKEIVKDEAEAVKWYLKAAEQGHAKAQNNLGLCYKEGTGVQKDDEEAAKWFSKAAAQGDADGQYNLGLCYIKE